MEFEQVTGGVDPSRVSQEKLQHQKLLRAEINHSVGFANGLLSRIDYQITGRKDVTLSSVTTSQ